MFSPNIEKIVEYKDEYGNILFTLEDIPNEAIEQNIQNVYRVCYNGQLDAHSFDCTYLSDRVYNPLKERDMNDPSTFSTSCFKKKSTIKNFLNTFRTHHPKAIIVIGNIVDYKGKSLSGKNHVNWWIYQNQNVVVDFKIMEALK